MDHRIRTAARAALTGAALAGAALGAGVLAPAAAATPTEPKSVATPGAPGGETISVSPPAAAQTTAGEPAPREPFATERADPSDGAQTPDGPATSDLTDTPDPFEPFNRRMYALHTGIDRAVIIPAARGFRALPEPLRRSLKGAGDNSKEPLTAVNSLLQGDVTNAGKATGRFLVNSTIGIAGLFDVAGRFNLESRDEDFGQTLGVWGLPPGPYFFIPGMGPSTLRDQVGRVGSAGLDPLNYVSGAGAVTSGVGTALRILDFRAATLEASAELEANAPDPYLTIRRLYAAAREDAVRNGVVDIDNLPQFEDIPPDLVAPADPVAPALEPPQP